MIRKKDLVVVALVVLLTAVAVEGAGIWISGVEAPITYDEEVAYVETLEAEDVTEDSATLKGELLHLRGYDDVDLYFEYREEDTEDWTRVDSLQTVSESTEFSEEIENLDDETSYEYRAAVEKEEEVLHEGLIVVFVTLTYDQGDGTEDNPYQINDWYEMGAIWNDLDAYYELQDHLDQHSYGYSDLVDTEDGWHPIGDENNRFSGAFDGQNYTISDLFIDRPEEDNLGLFGHVGHNNAETKIRDVCIKHANITGRRGIGTLIGRVTGNDKTLIEKVCAKESSVQGEGAVGGLIGSHNSWRSTPGGVDNPVLRESFADVDVTDQDDTSEPDKFGGLVGCGQKADIIDSYSLGYVTIDGTGTRIGGLAGCIDFRGKLTNSYSTGKVTAEDSTRVGSLVGNIEGMGGSAGRIENSYSNEETSGQTQLVGTIGDGDLTESQLFEDTTEMTDYEDEYPDSYEGWDFVEIWQYGGVTDREDNSGYPALQWQDN